MPIGIIAGAVGLVALYAAVTRFGRRMKQRRTAPNRPRVISVDKGWGAKIETHDVS